MAVIVEAPSGVPSAMCRQQQKPGNTVYVGNIPYQSSEQQVKDLCGEIGPVVSFKMILDKDTGKPKGYGFCEFLDEETALSACRNLNGAIIGGRQLRVNLSSKPKSKSTAGVVGAAPLPCNVGIRMGGPGDFLLPSSSLSFSSVNMDDNCGQHSQTQREEGQENGKLGELIGFLARNYSQENLCGLLADMLGMPENDKEAALALCPQLLNALFQAVPLATPHAFFSAAQPPPHPHPHLCGCGQKRSHDELDLGFHPQQQKGEAPTPYTPTIAAIDQGSPQMFSEPRPPKRLKLQLNDDDQDQSPLQPSTPPHTLEPIRCGTAHKRPAQHQLPSPSHQGGGLATSSPSATSIAFSADHSPRPTKRARLQDEKQPPLHLTSQLLDYLIESVKSCST